MATTSIQKINEEVTKELANKETMQTLLVSTFKGLPPENIKKAIVEGMIRGFTFKDFLEKNIYAIPYGQGYSLVTSIDYARKVGMTGGIVGKSEPIYEEKDGRIISCTVTVKKKFGTYIGDFSAKVFFSEYTTGRNQWVSKPRTMIAKVAEMHALRMACPEELSQTYTADEMGEKGEETKVEEKKPVEKKVVKKETKPEVSIETYEKMLTVCKDVDELKKVWQSMPIEARAKLEHLKEQIKLNFKK